MRRLLLGSLLVLWAASARAGVIVEVPFAMRVGDRAELMLERSKENPAYAAKGWPVERTRSVDLIEVVEELPGSGYLLRVASRAYEAEGGDPTARAVQRALMDSFPDLVVDFEVSRTGAPRRLRDWSSLVERISANLDRTAAQAGIGPGLTNEVSEVFRGLFLGLDEARATQFFGDGLMMWAAMHDLRIELGRIVEGIATEVSPLTGDPIDLAYRIRLTNLDRAGGLARVEVRQTASSESVARIVDSLIDQTVRSLREPLDTEGRARIRRLFDRPDNGLAIDQTFEVGLGDGWTRTVVDERTVRFGTAVRVRQLTRVTVRRLL